MANLYNGEEVFVKNTLVPLIYKSAEKGRVTNSSINISSAIFNIVFNTCFLVNLLQIKFFVIIIKLL